MIGAWPWTLILGDFKVLMGSSEKYATQRPHKESSSSGKKKPGKLVKFDKNIENMKSMATYAVPKKSEERRTKTPKSEPKVAAIKEDVHTYRIDHLNLSREEHDSESDSN